MPINRFHQKLTPKQIAAEIGWPVETWVGNCYAVASCIVKMGIVDGTPRYGMWLGHIHPHSPLQFGRHGWIEVDDGEGGRYIVDPTRWVFEFADPYIFVDYDEAGLYDVGANRLRALMLKPCPPYVEGDRIIDLALSPTLKLFVDELIGDPNPLTSGRVFWLSSLPLDRYADQAAPLFQALIDAGWKAAIPIDNLEYVLGEIS